MWIPKRYAVKPKKDVVTLDDVQKDMIRRMRFKGQGYGTIAKQLAWMLIVCRTTAAITVLPVTAILSG